MPLIREADRLGFHSVWTAEAYGSDAVTPLAWIAAQTERIHLGIGHHADAGAHARHDRDDRHDARSALRRPLPARSRRLRAAGRRGLARRRRTASRSCARASTSRSCAPSGRARSRSSTRASTTRSRTAARARSGLGKPLKSILHGRQIPDLPRRHRTEERRAVRGDRRRLAADLLLAVPRAEGLPAVARRRASRRRAAARASRSFDIAVVGHGHRRATTSRACLAW